jgi:hypothetical protein
MFDSKIIHPNGSQYMSDTPAPRHPGPDDRRPGTPPGPGDHPSLGSPGRTPVPQSPDWDEAWLAARAKDEYPGDPEEYQDPDNAPPAGLDDGQQACAGRHPGRSASSPTSTPPPAATIGQPLASVSASSRFSAVTSE